MGGGSTDASVYAASVRTVMSLSSNFAISELTDCLLANMSFSLLVPSDADKAKRWAALRWRLAACEVQRSKSAATPGWAGVDGYTFFKRNYCLPARSLSLDESR
jgi:hypothetical protein